MKPEGDGARVGAWHGNGWVHWAGREGHDDAEWSSESKSSTPTLSVQMVCEGDALESFCEIQEQIRDGEQS